MNEFLKTRNQIDEATRWLQRLDYQEHPISCKNWELSVILPAIGWGAILDMGADGSFILHNIENERRVGIDLAKVEGTNAAKGAEYHQGDLMHTPFADGEFDVIVSQSVIEHNVDLDAFANETSRLLKNGGKLIVSFDYWPIPPDTSHVSLYGLPWKILSETDVHSLIRLMSEKGLELSGNVDWSVGDAVINPQYCSPAQGISYTFGILEFIKHWI